MGRQSQILDPNGQLTQIIIGTYPAGETAISPDGVSCLSCGGSPRKGGKTMNAFIGNALEILSHVEAGHISTGAAISAPVVAVLAFFLA